MTKTLLLALAVTLAGATPALADPREPPEAFPCTGRWQGIGRNTGLPTPWGIDLVVHAPDEQGRCGTIEYTDPRCGGVLVDCRRGPPVVVREVYTHDEGCAAAGGQEFSCDGDTMQWAWLGWEVARTTLRRVGGQGGPSGAEAPERGPDGEPLPPADRVPAPPPPEPPAPPPPAPDGEPVGEGDGGRCGCRAVGRARSPGALLPLALAGLSIWKRRRS